MDLSALQDLETLLNVPVTEVASGTPIALDLALIDEDPDQPRKADNPGFSEASIAALGETIQARGVKTPISVRVNPEAEGRFIINHGARRYRGSRWAGRSTIPAFIDNDYKSADQLIENIQREDVTAREIADWIGRELAGGKKKGEIAKDLGKSPAFVTQHVTLLDLPDAIAEAFNSGRVRDVTVVNELVTAWKKDSEAVETWLADATQEATRAAVKLLREFVDEKAADGDGGDSDGDRNTGANDADQAPPRKAKKTTPVDPDKLKKGIVTVRHDGCAARLILTKRPSTEGQVWIKYDDSGEEAEVPAADVTLLALIEGQ